MNLTQFHTDRATAQKRYHQTFARWQVAAGGTDEAAFLAVNSEMDSARASLVAAEIAHPTQAEIRTRNRTLALRNRGLDV